MNRFAEFILTTFMGRIVLFFIVAASVFAYGSIAKADIRVHRDRIDVSGTNPIYVIGDSIAVGIANANGIDRAGNNRWRKGGKDPVVILRYIDNFIATGKARGAVVILSSGASNSTYERPNGTGRNIDITNIRKQIVRLKSAGSLVFLVGTGSGQSTWIHNRYGKYRVNFASQNSNGRLAALAREQDIVFLGPLENYGRLADGIHPSGQGARRIYWKVNEALNP